jgi:hypothetical protein
MQDEVLTTDYVDYCRLAYIAVRSGKSLPILWINVLPPSSGWKRSEIGGNMFLGTVSNDLPDCTISYSEESKLQNVLTANCNIGSTSFFFNLTPLSRRMADETAYTVNNFKY